MRSRDSMHYQCEAALWEERLCAVRDLLRPKGPVVKGATVQAPTPLGDGLSDILPMGLRIWVQQQRSKQQLGMLSDDRLCRLQQLSIRWLPALTPAEREWQARFRELEWHKYNTGSFLGVMENASLYQWLCAQVAAYESKTLDAIDVALLESLDLDWSNLHLSWSQQIARLEEFQEEFGHVHVAASDNEELYQWLMHARRHYQEEKLSAERVQQLTALHIEWDANKDRCLLLARHLKRFKQEYGNALTPQNCAFNSHLLDDFKTACQDYVSGKLDSVCRSILDKSGFKFRLGVATPRIAASWSATYAELKSYQLQYGSCIVNGTTHPKLAHWAEEQIHRYWTNQLSFVQIAQLLEIQFDFGPGPELLDDLMAEQESDLQWQQHFEAVVGFCKSTGSVNIPSDSSEHQAMATWVKRQQRLEQLGFLPASRRELLSSLNVVWYTENSWQQKLAELQQFAIAHGRCTISDDDPPQYFPLARWLRDQRIEYQADRLTAEQIQQLEKVGVTWELSVDLESEQYEHEQMTSDAAEQMVWSHMFNLLSEYHQTHQTTAVVRGDALCNQLCKWIKEQRILYWSGALSDERATQLNTLNLSWEEPRETNSDDEWDLTFTKLLQIVVHTGKAIDIASLSNDLASWCTKQQELYCHGSLRADRKERLFQIGFLLSHRREAST